MSEAGDSGISGPEKRAGLGGRGGLRTSCMSRRILVGASWRSGLRSMGRGSTEAWLRRPTYLVLGGSLVASAEMWRRYNWTLPRPMMKALTSSQAWL